MQEHQILPLPRICVLNKPVGVNEYGFDLHAEMGKGQFVGAVDVGSPAEISGLRPLDHILAVNGELIEGLSHKEVVQRIKSSSMGCALLVLDEDGYIWSKENNISTDFLLKQLKRTNKKDSEQIKDPREPKEFIESQISPPSFREETTESGSCSIGLPFSGSNSPYSFHHQQHLLVNSQQIPLEMGDEEELLSNVRSQQQKSDENNKNNNNFSPSPTQQLSPKFSDRKQSSPSAAIGRHTAVPVLPPSTLLANGPKPRLCLLIKGSPSQEFGFSLHAEGNGHFIGAVDSDGIAERAGLVTGQRIVGVNGHLVYPNTSHMDIVQIIQREPLRTELLVASEQVDRFYKEYGLAFSYDYVQFYDPAVMRNGNGKAPPLVGAAAVHSKQSPNAVKNQNGGYEKVKAVQRSRSGSRSVERNSSINKNNGHAIRGQSIGKRPPTPSSTYLSSSQQSNGNVAVQIEKRSDNMTSIEIGEIDVSEPSKIDENTEQHLFGIGTPPSSRCEKQLKNGHSVKNGGGKITNGVAGKGGRVEHVENSKHVIADGPVYSTDSPIKSPPPIAAPRTPRPERRYSPPQPLEIYHPAQFQQYDISPLSLQSDSTQSRTSIYKSRDSEKSIFALNAKEARKAICGRKKDPRLAGQMSLEDKHRLIMEL